MAACCTDIFRFAVGVSTVVAFVAVPCASAHDDGELLGVHILCSAHASERILQPSVNRCSKKC